MLREKGSARTEEKILVLDIGGSSIKFALADSENQLCQTGSRKITARELNGLLSQISEIFETLSGSTHIRGIAVSSPGFVDPKTGISGGTSWLPFLHGFSITQTLSSRFGGIPVSIENDANCAALGESWRGCGQGRRSLAMVVCGSGIGGAFVQDGAVRHGSNHHAAEFGFMPVTGSLAQPEIWSAYSVGNTLQRYESLTGKAVSGETLFASAAGGCDEAAALCVKQFYRALAIGCISVYFALDPELIVLGGAISTRPDLIEILLTEIHSVLCANPGFPPEDFCPVQASSLANLANLYGALYHYRREEQERLK